MKLAPWFVAAVAPFAVIGFGSSYIGHMAVVVLTLGIFFGTLSLGKASAVPTCPEGSSDPT